MGLLLKKDRQKIALFKRYGYDIAKARDLIIGKAGLPQGRILEVGTGKGHLAVALAKKGYRLTSIDLDPGPQKTAKAYIRKNRLGKLIRLKVMDAERLEFPSRSFESVISANFMHHAKKPMKCLGEMVRVAKDKIVISDVNKKGEAILERVHRLEGQGHPRSLITFSTIKEFLKKNGFVVKTDHGHCQVVIIAKKGA
jgi:ubiquinone/menaquinone biosynthesis C-methylase UbiE